MSKFEFKAEDFKWDVESLGEGIASQQMADRANALLQAHLEKCERVYQGEMERGYGCWWPDADNAIRTAVLFNLEEVKD